MEDYLIIITIIRLEPHGNSLKRDSASVVKFDHIILLLDMLSFPCQVI
jgi:hypothetical protein